jgi:hypothetical protein
MSASGTSDRVDVPRRAHHSEVPQERRRWMWLVCRDGEFSMKSATHRSGGPLQFE